MQQLTTHGQQAIQDLAKRYSTSVPAVTQLLAAVVEGRGSMAQFSIPELGGSGQWMAGGMTMVGDMFNVQLQNKVASLCAELANLLPGNDLYEKTAVSISGGAHSAAWWPDHLGQPSASGAQNDTQYAVFPHLHRLAICQRGKTTLYDTLDHHISGVQQQNGDLPSLSFSSQHGTFVVSSLPVADLGEPLPSKSFAEDPQTDVKTPLNGFSSAEIVSAIEQLGQLYQKGILTEIEFQNKKKELLDRL